MQISTWDLRLGYANAAFPMGDEDGRIQWYTSLERAVFPMSGIHLSRSLQRTLARGGFEVRFDNEFELVMRSCLRPSDNWITEELIRVYVQAHREGWAHCSEVWVGSDLVGGVYGLAVGACFCAESMFHRQTNMSKVALWALVERCRKLGFTMFDAQVMNPHLESLGAFSISPEEYRLQLDQASQKWTEWSGPPFDYCSLQSD